MKPDPQILRVLTTIGEGIVTVDDVFDEDDLYPGISRAVDSGFVRCESTGASGSYDIYSLTNRGREALGLPPKKSLLNTVWSLISGQ